MFGIVEYILEISFVLASGVCSDRVQSTVHDSELCYVNFRCVCYHVHSQSELLFSFEK